MDRKKGIIRIELQDEKEFWGIQKWNDYVYVQRTVWNKLVDSGILSRNGTLIKNKETDMIIEIGHSGIKETFGPGTRYLNLKREIKELKIAVIRYLPQLLETAKLIEDNITNHHETMRNTKYAYFENYIVIDDDLYDVIFDVRKSIQKNKFWVHRIITKSRDTDYVEQIANHT